MKKIWVVPTLLTLANGFFGFLALAKSADATMLGAGNPEFATTLEYAAVCLLLAMIFDALDGAIARWLKAPTELGAQLDSLCDAVTFGVAPGVIFKTLVEREAARHGPVPVAESRYYLAAGACYALCALLRLARFNVESTQGREDHKAFRGLPSPGAAIVVASTVLVFYDERWTRWFPSAAPVILDGILYAMPVAMVGLGVLMISRIGYPHFAAAMLRRRWSFRSFAYLVVAIAVALMDVKAFLFAGSVAFALYGPVSYVVKRVRGRGVRPQRA